MAKADVDAFFAGIRAASDEIAPLNAAFKAAELAKNAAEAARYKAQVDKLVAAAQKAYVNKYFYTYNEDDLGLTGIGNLDMVDSAISSHSGAIYAMAGSRLNVGKTALSNAPLKTSGITTLFGGGLSIYAGGDVNVNESRLMTYLGGDITVWSDQGSINAGRGSKTVVSAPTKIFNFDPTNPGVLLSVTLTPPSAGSGIRALTFDPDDTGPLPLPEAGTVHIYTPKTLDAGEAGIQGGRLVLSASTVLNSQNITAGAGSVGVPASSQNTISIGSMSGATDLASDKKMIETISGGGESARKTALAQAEDFLMKYLDVKVIDLSEGTL
jgi:hypothetical protein